jgi:hypothetical protein
MEENPPLESGLWWDPRAENPDRYFSRLNIVDDSDDFLPPPSLPPSLPEFFEEDPVTTTTTTTTNITTTIKRPRARPGRPSSSSPVPSSNPNSPSLPSEEEEDEALQRDRKRRKLNSAQDDRLRLIEAREKEELEREDEERDGNGLDVLEIRPCDEEVSRGMSLTSPLTWMMWYEAQLVQLVVMLMLISGNCDLPFFETIPPSPSTADQPQLPLSPFSSPHLSNLLSPQLKH